MLLTQSFVRCKQLLLPIFSPVCGPGSCFVTRSVSPPSGCKTSCPNWCITSVVLIIVSKSTSVTDSDSIKYIRSTTLARNRVSVDWLFMCFISEAAVNVAFRSVQNISSHTACPVEQRTMITRWRNSRQLQTPNITWHWWHYGTGHAYIATQHKLIQHLHRTSPVFSLNFLGYRKTDQFWTKHRMGWKFKNKEKQPRYYCWTLIHLL